MGRHVSTGAERRDAPSSSAHEIGIAFANVRKAFGDVLALESITFEIERSETALEAELYISVDRAKENAKKYHVEIEEELIRLIVHGTLHLAGYSDETSSSMNQMRRRERWYLTQIRP